MAFKFEAKDAVRRYVKYRLINLDPTIEESGMPMGNDQRTPWIMHRLPDEMRPPHYLRLDFKERLSKGPIQYKLQIQLHEWNEETDTNFLFNSGVGWDTKTHPWKDLAIVVINLALDNEIIERTRFNIANYPPSLGIVEEPLHLESFTSLGYVRPRVYRQMQNIRLLIREQQETSKFLNPTHYIVFFKTDNFLGSQSDFFISIQLHGLERSTNWHTVSNIFKSELETNKIKHFSIFDEDVFPIQLISLKTRSPDLCKWFVEKIFVVDPSTNHKSLVPLFRWIGPNEEFTFAVTTSIPQQRNELIQEKLDIELQKKRELYQWKDRGDSLPGYLTFEWYGELPLNVRFEFSRKLDFDENALLGNIQIVVNHLHVMQFWTKPEEYAGLIPKSMTPKHIVELWNDDFEFGFQILNGVHPLYFKKISEIPEYFPVTDELVKLFLSPEKTLEVELQAGRIFILDYVILEGVPIVAGRYVTPALCLLYLNHHNQMTPIAIQLQQKHSPDNPIFLPNDGPDWTIAKLFVKCADAQIHELISHLLNTHLVTEPFAIACLRNLSENHPIFKLLWPHLRYLITINTLGRITLVPKGGIIDRTTAVGLDLIYKAYQSWNVDMMNFPKTLKDRGVENVPNYYFKDDALAIWNSIERFVMAIIRLWYKTDMDVKRDRELQDWITDIATNGLPNGRIYNTISSIEQLNTLLVGIIWISTCGHASVNSPQFEYYCFIPNYPFSLRKAPPTTKGSSESVIMHYLPGIDGTTMQIATAYYLSSTSKDEVFLTQMKPNFWTDPESRHLLAEWIDNLVLLGDKIERRNHSIEPEYHYLKPQLVPSTLSI